MTERHPKKIAEFRGKMGDLKESLDNLSNTPVFETDPNAETKHDENEEKKRHHQIAKLRKGLKSVDGIESLEPVIPLEEINKNKDEVKKKETREERRKYGNVPGFKYAQPALDQRSTQSEVEATYNFDRDTRPKLGTIEKLRRDLVQKPAWVIGTVITLVGGMGFFVKRGSEALDYELRDRISQGQQLGDTIHEGDEKKPASDEVDQEVVRNPKDESE